MSLVRKKSVRLLVVLIAVAVTLAFMPAAGGTAFAVVKRPAKVKHVRVVKKTKHSVTLRWKKAKRAKKYRVYKYSAKKHKYVRVKTTKKRKAKIKGLKAGKAYKFKVRGIRGKKKGKPSKAIRVRTKGKAKKNKYCTVAFVYRVTIDDEKVGRWGYGIDEVTVTKKVRKGGTVKAPVIEELIIGNTNSVHEFLGWDKSLKNIRKNTVIKAKYNLMTWDEYLKRESKKHPETRLIDYEDYDNGTTSQGDKTVE